MWTIVVAAFSLISSVSNGRILLYNTENDPAVERFDCMYHIPEDGQEVAYCQRPNGVQKLNRKSQECENQGEKKLFRDLLNQNIKPREVMQWSSSVEMIEMYASIFNNQSLIYENDLDWFMCNCTKLGTFGKYCEYEFTHQAKSFSEAIEAQFKQKKDGDSWNTQRYGKIVCYETLPCHQSVLCLDWREICDGHQRCTNGTDEENWDKLEFNECEDDEFRCINGMCIPEEFWLDGDWDCMDWSDELSYLGEICSHTPNPIDCDEHVCLSEYYSCGDGQCIPWQYRPVFQRFTPILHDCFNKRNLNFMCEMSLNRRAWTLKSGLCWPDESYDDPRYSPWALMNSTNLDATEKCSFLFRCIFSDNLEVDCPCKHRNCTEMMKHVCPWGNLVLYPPQGLISHNVLIAYDYTLPITRNRSDFLFALRGDMKCRGYHLVNDDIPNLKIFESHTILFRITNHMHCALSEHQDYLSPLQHDKFCWNESLTFNGRPYAVNPEVCTVSGNCISQYRIRDGFKDCLDGQDEGELVNKDYCTKGVRRHRFGCFDEQHMCLPLFFMGMGSQKCSNGYDGNRYGTDRLDSKIGRCSKDDDTSCMSWREYIQQSSVKKVSINNLLINPEETASIRHMDFLEYCDTFWHLKGHMDEASSNCQHWVCQRAQYQCQTGQCIPLQWVCDGVWDCSDASDEENIVLIKKWSSHNAKLPDLKNRTELCRQRYSKSPFSKICNVSFEFGCYLSRVSDPLNITLNRPCINLTQIGDGIEDCYNAYDERNTLEVSSSMVGFDVPCGSQRLDPVFACMEGAKGNCTHVLCSNHRDKGQSCSNYRDAICLENNICKKNARCDGKPDCPHGEDEYWCASARAGYSGTYRRDKEINRGEYIISISVFPPAHVLISNHTQVTDSIINHRNDNLFTIHSYQCNRGVAILEKNETRCLCPPAYYGPWCEFFSDRISIIARIDRKALLKTLSNMTFKIKSNLLFDNTIVDYNDFTVFPVNKSVDDIKHKFYLLYSRSDHMLVHKRARYFNRTDVINNHPYSVHFDLFLLEQNGTMREVGSWHYTIHFDFLPAFRLAIILKFPFWFGNVTLDPCSSNGCNENSSCVPILNRNHSYYCSCKSGYYGKDCTIYEPLCKTYCSANSICQLNMRINKSKPHCICPLNHFGPRCILKYDGCDSNPCFNNGTCIVRIDPSGEVFYACMCFKQFYGNQCEKKKASVYVELNVTGVFSVRATVVQFHDLTARRQRLLVQHQQVHRGLPSTIHYNHHEMYAPVLGLLKIYTESTSPQYFLMYFLEEKTINISSSACQCPYASSLLSEDATSFVSAVFKYHQICQNDTERYCFHDVDYFCMCSEDHYNALCLNHDTRLDYCDNCLSTGQCLRGDLENSKDFICLCPRCYQGRLCEFNLEAFGFTFDSLLVVYSKPVKIVYASICFLFLIVGLFNNMCSFTTFKRPASRKFANGNYLLIVACLSQISLLCLSATAMQIVVESFDIGSCKTISYLLAVFTRSIYWLTTWASISGLLVVIVPNSSIPKNPRLAIGISFVTVITLLVMHVHEIIYTTSIQHIPTGSFICVIDINSHPILIYNRVTTLIHYSLPFSIQIVCITLLIVLAARSRAKTARKDVTFYEVLKKQFFTQKELYITPITAVFSALPQLIITFSLACTEFKDWQRHLLLSAYLLSYAPHFLGFILYVMPSTLYKKEFNETYIYKKILQRILDKKNKNVIQKKK